MTKTQNVGKLNSSACVCVWEGGSGDERLKATIPEDCRVATCPTNGLRGSARPLW